MGLSGGVLILHFDIKANDMSSAGEASSSVKRKLNQLGVNPQIVKKAAIAMYEAEINTVIHSFGGCADVEIGEDKIRIIFTDEGPGIPDISLAMQEGYSTAPDEVREMGFGAGMGLPNMKRYSDVFDIKSEVGKGTVVTIEVFIKDN